MKLFLCFLLVISIHGCSFVGSKEDGAPSNKIDLSEVQDAVPKLEPISKYGNPKNYKVFGKQYSTLSNSKGFKQAGLASWYGTKFHGRKTSSGEPYNMYAMTGAHKTLPLPTYAKITNKENNKSIIIKINDRGPFHSNRIVDLSYAAAAKLGVLRRGTANIELTAIDPITYNQPMAKNNKTRRYIKDNTDKLVTMQIGAFTEKNLAQRLVNSTANLIDHPVKIHSENNADKPLYKVHLGPFPEYKLNNIKSKLADIKVFNPITIAKKF